MCVCVSDRLSPRFLDRRRFPPLPVDRSDVVRDISARLIRGIIIHRISHLPSLFISRSHDAPTRNERGVQTLAFSRGQRHERQTPRWNIGAAATVVISTTVISRSSDSSSAPGRLTVFTSRSTLRRRRFSRDTSLSLLSLSVRIVYTKKKKLITREWKKYKGNWCASCAENSTKSDN